MSGKYSFVLEIFSLPQWVISEWLRLFESSFINTITLSQDLKQPAQTQWNETQWCINKILHLCQVWHPQSGSWASWLINSHSAAWPENEQAAWQTSWEKKKKNQTPKTYFFCPFPFDSALNSAFLALVSEMKWSFIFPQKGHLGVKPIIKTWRLSPSPYFICCFIQNK